MQLESYFLFLGPLLVLGCDCWRDRKNVVDLVLVDVHLLVVGPNFAIYSHSESDLHLAGDQLVPAGLGYRFECTFSTMDVLFVVRVAYFEAR